MDDVIFGTLLTDALKLMHHRLSWSGLQHQHCVHPRDPKPGEPVYLTVFVGPDCPVTKVTGYCTFDGSEPSESEGQSLQGSVVQFVRVGVEWDSISWGYRVRWEAVLPPQPETTSIRYQINGWTEDGTEYYADWPLVKRSSEAATSAYFRGEPIEGIKPVGNPQKPYTFVLSVDHLKPPKWAREAVIYHVFVDRFFPGMGRDWLQVKDLNGFCGGTLWGVKEKLDYIEELGADCIWLSPVFCSGTHHGYDVTDYDHVEPRLGGDEALRALVEAAHQRGIRVILDIALNHVSVNHPIFQDALHHPNSLYREWFTFDDSEVGYETYFGIASMPKVNAAYPPARQWLINVGLYWLTEFKVDGFRLDVADGPGPDFWVDFWTACKAVKPDCFCFGEVVDAPEIEQQYIGRLDGLLDFALCDGFRRTFARKLMSREELARFQARHQQAFPDDFLMLSFIDNHDMNRFLLLAGGDRSAIQAAAEYQFSLPNPPVIYYGTEIGLTQSVKADTGWGLHLNRVPMQWDSSADDRLYAFYKRLIAERRRRSGS